MEVSVKLQPKITALHFIWSKHFTLLACALAEQHHQQQQQQRAAGWLDFSRPDALFKARAGASRWPVSLCAASHGGPAVKARIKQCEQASWGGRTGGSLAVCCSRFLSGLKEVKKKKTQNKIKSCFIKLLTCLTKKRKKCVNRAVWKTFWWTFKHPGLYYIIVCFVLFFNYMPCVAASLN